MAFVMPETTEVVCFACGEDLSEGVTPCPACGSEETTLVCRLVPVAAPVGREASAPAVGLQPEASRA
jgi:anaerobic ribonucleoside-triphosphate reductase